MLGAALDRVVAEDARLAAVLDRAQAEGEERDDARQATSALARNDAKALRIASNLDNFLKTITRCVDDFLPRFQLGTVGPREETIASAAEEFESKVRVCRSAHELLGSDSKSTARCCSAIDALNGIRQIAQTERERIEGLTPVLCWEVCFIEILSRFLWERKGVKPQMRSKNFMRFIAFAYEAIARPLVGKQEWESFGRAYTAASKMMAQDPTWRLVDINGDLKSAYR